MGMKKMFYNIKPPCAKCPYTLGLVYTFINLCPQCKSNGYQSYEWFQRHLPAECHQKNDDNIMNEKYNPVRMIILQK